MLKLPEINEKIIIFANNTIIFFSKKCSFQPFQRLYNNFHWCLSIQTFFPQLIYIKRYLITVERTSVLTDTNERLSCGFRKQSSPTYLSTKYQRYIYCQITCKTRIKSTIMLFNCILILLTTWKLVYSIIYLKHVSFFNQYRPLKLSAQIVENVAQTTWSNRQGLILTPITTGSVHSIISF